MKKFHIETYGCQMNVSDSETVAALLVAAGYAQAVDITEADVILFNTCSVRAHAEERVMGRINAEAARKREKPELKIGVIGCMAQRLQDDLTKQNAAVDFAAGVDRYRQLPDLIEGRSISRVQTQVDYKELYNELYPLRQEGGEAFVTIMRGCNNFCSYCIVPHLRGRERSRDPETILAEIARLGREGYQEVTLLGQNVNSYRHQDWTFPRLLEEAAALRAVRRLRFVTSHPKDLSDDLIRVMSTAPGVCHHVHLPLQAGNNQVLQRMNRGYTIEHYLNLVKKLRQAMPDIALSTDIIAGFPGETEEQFNDTMAALHTVRFDHAFLFKYSPRSGTPAADSTDQVPEEVRLKRLERLIDAQSIITTQRYKEEVGKVKEIFVRKVSKRNEKELSGKSDDFRITVFAGGPELLGRFVKVKITEAAGWTLRGELIP